MLESFNEIVIEKRVWPVGKIINDFGTNGVIILDNSYEIPAMCAHMDDNLISTLLREESLIIYGVHDSKDYLHVNVDDFNRLKNYLDDNSNALNKIRRSRAKLELRSVDYRVREDLKKDFWMKVLPCNSKI